MSAQESAELPWTPRPEAHPLFRVAQLLLVLKVTHHFHPQGVTLERLAYYEFFAAHPFLVFSTDDEEWRDLVAVGQELATVAYASTHHRFVTARQRLRQDLAGLGARGFIEVRNVEGRILVDITHKGAVVADDVHALYAQALDKSASMVIKKLKSFSDSKLVEEAHAWFNYHPVFIDL